MRTLIYGVVFLISARVVIAESDTRSASAPIPLLPATDPIQRLGDSEFRLPRRDGRERMFQFSPDGKLIAACNWDEVRLWTFPDGKGRSPV